MLDISLPSGKQHLVSIRVVGLYKMYLYDDCSTLITFYVFTIEANGIKHMMRYFQLTIFGV